LNKINKNSSFEETIDRYDQLTGSKLMESVGHSSVEEVEKSIEDDDDDDEDDPLITNAKLRIKIQD